MTQLFVSLLRAYQWTLSAVLGSHCRFHPTCSAYAIEALETHGLARGSVLALRRITRCHPYNPGGVDHVPPPDTSRAQH